MNEIKHLKKIIYSENGLPAEAEDGALYILPASLFAGTSSYAFSSQASDPASDHLSAHQENHDPFIAPQHSEYDKNTPALQNPNNDIPFVIYRDASSEDTVFSEGVKYVLEGEGSFDPEDFDDDYLECIYRRLKKIPWDILETDRCVIRETCVSDLDAFYEIYANPEITRFTEDLMERSEEERYTENYRDLIYEIYGHGIWTVILKDSGEIIGRAGLDERAGFDTPELGFVIGRKWQRQGLATEICEGILRWAADNEMYSIMSLTERENTTSVRLLEKLGFTEKDTVNIGGTDLVRYMKKL